MPQIGSADLERLERPAEITRRLALALGQDPELLKQIEAEQVHPAMAAFGLWRDQEELTSLADDIAANRRRQGAGRRVVPFASIALQHSAPLLTHNQRHLGRVLGLAVEDWLQ